MDPMPWPTKVMKDPRLAAMMDPKTLPFDGKRMFCGGFKLLVKTWLRDGC